MVKRIKLNRLVAGPSMKQIYGTILVGDSNPTTEVRSDIYVAGQQGNLLTTNEILADSTLYNIGYFDREYSVKNPDIVDNGVELKVTPTNSDIVDIIQFGDYAFNLTNETTLGTQYSTITTPNYFNYWYTSDKEEYLEPHEIAVYPTSGDLGELANGSHALSGVETIIKNIPFNVTPETPDMVYGYISEGDMVLYVKDQNLNSDTVYSLTGGIKNSLPFAYLMEQPLMYSANYGREAMVYGGVSDNEVFAYTPLILSGVPQELYSPYTNDEEAFEIYYNPFKLKNMYNYNWNCEYNIEQEEMTGVRDYLKVGKAQENLWLSYRYYRSHLTKIQEFELIERFGGLYKYRPIEGHKSNIYSIRVFNSGLNEDLNNTPEELEIQNNLRNIIEETVRNVVKKIAPASTQLWKVEFVGR